MFKIVELIQNKPTDRNIRITRGVFAFILAAIIFLGFSHTHFEYSQIPQEALYALYIFPLIGLTRSIFDPGIFRRKVWKWTQVGIGLIMILISFFLIETVTETQDTKQVQTTNGTLSLDNIPTKNTQSFSVDTDFWFGFMGLIILLNGLILSSKNVTKKNERFWEKVTKIRV